jgi:hypothetical protein
MGMDTVDIEDFANQVKKDVVVFFTNLIWTNITAAAPWVNVPVLREILKAIIESIVTFLATTGGLVAFIINTKVFTTDQAKDYTEAVGNLMQLPEDVSDEEWDKAERAANHAFANLVSYRK